MSELLDSQPSQESQASEDWDSEDEEEDMEDYNDYYGDGDADVISVGEEGTARDASFQQDPEFYEFSCLSTEETWNYLDSQVREVSRELKVDVPSSRMMLQSLHWDTKVLVKRYSDDQQAVMIETRLRSKKPETVLNLLDQCPICLLPASQARMHGLVCGHMFCTQCWTEYLAGCIKNGVAASIECMQCSMRMSLEMVQSLLQSSAALYAKFLKYALTDFVLSHSLLRWCSGVECTMVFQVKQPLAKQVTCSKCHTSCCFKCGDPYHCPTECETIRKWLNKCHDDSETANYIQANTKDCPRCHITIEKNGGCNHMNCSQCYFDFCWMCLAEWKSHNGYFNCNKYQENEETSTRISAARESLKRYLHYYERWALHDQSLKLEEATQQKILHRAEVKVSLGEGTWIDWQYLLDAVALLRKCRYTLKYTYPYAYYLEGDRKPLFEYQQAQLETEIENLSWKVERAETTDVADIQQQMNATEIKRLTLLRDFVP